MNAANVTTLSHGHARHGHETPEYHTWVGMRARCRDTKLKNYKDYGGRGIYVCCEWDDSFVAFLSDMGPKPTASHSLDRIDNDGPYAPWNCRWATKSEQARNKRPVRNQRTLTVDGVTHTHSEWARIAGLRLATLDCRVRQGWPPKAAVFAPLGTNYLMDNGIDRRQSWARSKK